MSKPEVGQHVSVRAGPYDDDPWHDCVVTDLLSVQFTATREAQKPDGGRVERVQFAFYADEGVTWKQLN